MSKDSRVGKLDTRVGKLDNHVRNLESSRVPGRLPDVSAVHLEVEECLNGVVCLKAVQVDIDQLLHEEAGVGVHDEAGAVRGVAGDAWGGRTLVLEVTAGRGRRQLDTIALEETFVQGWKK